MISSRFANAAQLFLFAFAGMVLGACDSLAQQSCPGAKKGECVEVTLRYYEQPYKEGYKIQLVDPKTLKELPSCRVCDPAIDQSCTRDNRCPGLDGSTIRDASSLLLLQSHKSPGCYYFCSGGWCRWWCS